MLNIANVEFWGSPLYHRFCAMCQYCWQQNSPRAWQYHPDTQQLVQCYAWKPNSDNNVKWSNKELTGLGIFSLRHRRTFNSIFKKKNTCIHSLISVCMYVGEPVCIIISKLCTFFKSLRTYEVHSLQPWKNKSSKKSWNPPNYHGIHEYEYINP